MTPKTQRQLALLAALVLLLTIVLVLRPGEDAPAETGVTPSNSPAPGGGAGRAEDVTDVRLELLQTERDSLSDAERNPFRFEAKAPPPAPVAPRPRSTGEFQAPAPFTPTGPPPPPPIPLRYIGLANAEGSQAPVAIFSDGRGHVFQGREGATIEGRYKVVRIGNDSVELAYLDGRGRQTIRLSGQ